MHANQLFINWDERRGGERGGGGWRATQCESVGNDGAVAKSFNKFVWFWLRFQFKQSPDSSFNISSEWPTVDVSEPQRHPTLNIFSHAQYCTNRICLGLGNWPVDVLHAFDFLISHERGCICLIWIWRQNEFHRDIHSTPSWFGTWTNVLYLQSPAVY